MIYLNGFFNFYVDYPPIDGRLNLPLSLDGSLIISLSLDGRGRGEGEGVKERCPHLYPPPKWGRKKRGCLPRGRGGRKGVASPEVGVSLFPSPLMGE